jgi:hypothetical protein
VFFIISAVSFARFFVMMPAPEEVKEEEVKEEEVKEEEVKEEEVKEEEEMEPQNVLDPAGVENM